MTGLAHVAPAGPASAGRRHRHAIRWLMTAVGLTASVAAMVVLATRADREVLDYSVGLVPALVPWLAAVLAVAIAVVGLSDGRARSAGASLVVGLVVVLTAWSVVMLPFDALRIVGLVPLPLSGWGLGLRLALVVAAATSVSPALQVQRAHRERCRACGRALPGRFDRLPRWPVVLGTIAALVYPLLRTIWAMGGTFGLSGEPIAMDPALAWGVVVVGVMLVAFAVFLLLDKGPGWARALFGLGGLMPGAALTTIGALAAFGASTMLLREGPWSTQGDEGIRTWIFVLVYGSWCVAGVGVLVGSWRYWAHRRFSCAACGPLLAGRAGGSPP